MTDEVSLPALLRAARLTYRSVVRDALAATEFDDLPGNGPYVVGAIAATGAPLSQIIKGLGVSKQSAGQLVDTLVMRGYLQRSVDPEDRRRLTITLTDRGQEAARVVREAVADVETELVAWVGAECVAQARTALAALADLGHEPE